MKNQQKDMHKLYATLKNTIHDMHKFFYRVKIKQIDIRKSRAVRKNAIDMHKLCAE